MCSSGVSVTGCVCIEGSGSKETSRFVDVGGQSGIRRTFFRLPGDCGGITLFEFTHHHNRGVMYDKANDFLGVGLDRVICRVCYLIQICNILVESVTKYITFLI